MIFGSARDQMIRRHVPVLPDIGGMGSPGLGTQQQMPQQAPQARPQRSTMQRVAGYLADALAGVNGQAGPYAQQLAYEQQMRDRDAMRQRDRADDYADFQQRERFKASLPRPAANNDTVADFQFIRQTLGDEAAQEFLRNKANPPAYRVGPDGQFYRVDVATPPARPVGRLTPMEEDGAGNGAGGFPGR